MKRSNLSAWSVFLSCCLLASLFVRAQDGAPHTHRIKGTVKGLSDGAGLVGATVTLAGDKKVATATDASGNFVLTIPANFSKENIQLEITSIGFEKKTVSVQPGQSSITVDRKSVV